MGVRDHVTHKEFSINDDVFRLPASGYFFNNSDCWARIDGTRARVGVSDYVRLNPVDILSFKPPEVGLKIAIFDELCSFTTNKMTIDIRSPVSGKVVAFNQELVEAPGIIKEDPYERGWAVELELTDIADDIELLMDCNLYYDVAKAKLESGPRGGCHCTRRGAIVRQRDNQGRK